MSTPASAVHPTSRGHSLITTYILRHLSDMTSIEASNYHILGFPRVFRLHLCALLAEIPRSVHVLVCGLSRASTAKYTRLRRTGLYRVVLIAVPSCFCRVTFDKSRPTSCTIDTPVAEMLTCADQKVSSTLHRLSYSSLVFTWRPESRKWDLEVGS